MRERLAAAGRLSARLAPLLDPRLIVEAAVDELHYSFQYEIAYITRREGGRLQVQAVGGTITGTYDVPLWSQSLDQGISGRVARTGTIALVQDTSLDPDHLAATAIRPDVDVTLLSQLAVPLEVAGRVWGVLSIQDTERRAFNSDDVLLLETIASQVSAALQRAEMHAEVSAALARALDRLAEAGIDHPN